MSDSESSSSVTSSSTSSRSSASGSSKTSSSSKSTRSSSSSRSKKSGSSKSSRNSKSESKRLQEFSEDEPILSHTPRKGTIIEESDSLEDSGTELRVPKRVALESPSATESGGESAIRPTTGGETDSEQVQKNYTSVPAPALSRVDQLKSGKGSKIRSDSENEYSNSDAEKGGDSRISHNTGFTSGTGTSRDEQAEFFRPKAAKTLREESDYESESKESSSKASSKISKSDVSSSTGSTSNTSDSSSSSSSSDDSDTPNTDSDSESGSSSGSESSGSESGSTRSSSSIEPLVNQQPETFKKAPTKTTAQPPAQPPAKQPLKPVQQPAKPVEVQDVNVTLIKKEKPAPIAEEEPDNAWTRFGRWIDSYFFTELFIPVTGILTIVCLVIFSIVIDLRLSGHSNIKYGYSFIPLMFAVLMWAILLFAGALSRIRYAANILRVPTNDDFFDRRWFNKEGARMGVLIFSSLALIMSFIFLVITSVKVDGGHWATSWRNPFIPLWIMLGFIFVAILFSWRLMHGCFNLIIHLMITGGVTALTIAVYLKIQGHLSASATWIKVLSPLWILNIFLLIILFWHVFARTVFDSMMHPTSAFRKHNKRKARKASIQDKAASVPLGVAGVFMFLFEVVIVAYVEGVFKGKFEVPWSFVWVWFWLACLFALIWAFTYKNDARESIKRSGSEEV